MKPTKKGPAKVDENEQKIWLMTFSYESDPSEDIAVHEAARKRYSKSKNESILQVSVFFFFFVIVIFAAIIELTRRFAPIFAEKGGIGLYYATYITAFLPTGVILLLTFTLYLRMLARKRRNSRKSHVSKGWRDIEIYEDGIKIMEPNSEHWYEWTAVKNVSHSSKEILLDLNITAFHIPIRAFPEKMDYLVKAKEIRKIWQEWLMQAIAEHEVALSSAEEPSEAEQP